MAVQYSYVMKGLTKTFPGAPKPVLDNIHLQFLPGTKIAIIGKNGAGKSTLLRMLSGFEGLTSGQIIIDGQDQAGIPPYNRPTNMMFQTYALFPHMTVEKNIAYGLKRDGLPRAEIATRVTDCLLYTSPSPRD